jgi:hypothetical protein
MNRFSSNTIFLLLTGLIFVQTCLNGQQCDADTFKITAKAIITPKGNQVLVRWSPLDFPTWRCGVVKGYHLKRYLFTRTAGIDLANSEFFETDVIPIDESGFSNMADTSDLAGVAAGAMYGDSLELLPSSGGGGMMNIFNKSRESENRFGFSLFAADQNINIAIAMGLGYVDDLSTLDAHSEYVYVISIIDDGTVPQIMGNALINTDSITSLPKPTSFKAQPGDRTAYLKWDKNDKYFSSFAIQRADHDGGAFTTINSSPFLFSSTINESSNTAVYPDSLPANGVTYIYRVRGRSPFGMLSDPSDTIHVTGIPGALIFDMAVTGAVETNAGSLTVSWMFPSALESQITGFDLYRGNDSRGPFTKVNSSVISASVRSYTDASPQASNYYMIKTSDTHGHHYKTFPLLGQLKDDTPPSQPVVSTGICDASGVVTLTWARNTEPDLLGYRVFMANTNPGDFAQVTSTWINDTVYRYQINLNTLTKNVYFGVKALDLHQNQSVMSAPFLIVRPDIIPPSPPIIKDAQAGATGVYFTWELSSSDDVAAYILQRKAMGIPGWIPVVTFNPGHPLFSYTDTSASKRKWYEYRLLARDQANLESSSKIIKIKPLDSGLRGPIQNFTGSYVSSPKSVALTWNYPKDADLIGFEVFRSVQDSNHLRAYGFLAIPPPSNGSGTSAFDVSATYSGGQWVCRFADKDLNFHLPQVNNFVNLSGSSVNPNQSVPTPGLSSSAQPYVTSNPNNLSGQSGGNTQPTKLYYRVMAKFADGGYSALSGWVVINL